MRPKTYEARPYRLRAVLEVVGQSSADILEFLWRLYSMCIVVAQDSFSVGLVQRKCIANSMRYFLRRDNTPSFDLDPIPSILIGNLIVEVNQGFNSRVIAHFVVYHLMIQLRWPACDPSGRTLGSRG